MKKHLLPILSLCLLLAFFAEAQGQSRGAFPYQAVARHADGTVIKNQNLLIRIAFAEKDKVLANHYVETHEVTTDEFGYYSLKIGFGKPMIGAWEKIPWAKSNLWMGIEISDEQDINFVLQGRTELQTVPYAFSTQTASQLANKEVEARNQSIYWNSSGNLKTRPPVHYTGTRDEQDLVFKTNMKTRMVITKDGQVQVYAGETIEGKDDKVESYALVIYGNNQGMWIKLDTRADSDNNYMTFEDKNKIQGRIEGQTAEELMNSFDFIAMNTMFGLNLAEDLAKTAAELVQAVGLVAAAAAAAASIFLSFAAGGFSAAAAADFVKSIVFLAESLAVVAETAAWNSDAIENVGVVYESGGADYAEWLKRGKDERDMLPGEIVGVQGGKISLNTTGVDHLMVVSTKPIFLGNAKDAEGGERVAFLGQVPVKVIGPVKIGDYILPSGQSDGSGIAIPKSKMKAKDYKHIVGVAWENSGEEEVNMINTAIGMHQNAIHGEVEKLSGKVDNILSYLQGEGPLRPEVEEEISVTNHPLRPKVLTPEDQAHNLEVFDQFVDQQSVFLKKYYGELKTQFEASGLDMNQYPLWDKLINDPINTIKEIRRDPRSVDQWKYLDQAIQSANN